MSELSKSLRHYLAQLDLWWARRRRLNAERMAAQRSADQASEEQRRRSLAGGPGFPSGWYQDPTGPPGYQRWWSGDQWTEHVQPARAAQPQGDGSGLAAAGWISFAVGLLFWPAFLATFVIGIIVAARGRGGTGAALIILSVIGPIVSIAVLSAGILGAIGS